MGLVHMHVYDHCKKEEKKMLWIGAARIEWTMVAWIRPYFILLVFVEQTKDFSFYLAGVFRMQSC